MALTFDEKIAIAKLKTARLTPYAIAKRIGIRREKIYRNNQMPSSVMLSPLASCNVYPR